MYTQPSLFDSIPLAQPVLVKSQPVVSGVTYVKNFITEAEEKQLIQWIDSGIWLNDLKRRVQHFGYKYDYRLRRIDPNMHIGVLPEWLQQLAVRLTAEGFFEEYPDQVIANEYEPGQGITPHIDCEPCFAGTVVSLSLNSTAIMEFSRTDEKVPYLLEPRSIVALTGEARYSWTHCIPARKKDVLLDRTYLRKRRVSLTFRKVVDLAPSSANSRKNT